MAKQKTPDAYKVTPRFIFQSIRNMGFTPTSCIFELIDNAIDAGATWIKLKWEKDVFGLNVLTIEDNGKGMHKTKIIPNLATLGTPEVYTAERVGYYGVGFNASLINLMENGEATITTTHLNDTNTLKIKHEDKLVNFNIIEKGDIGKKNGTKIHIPNINQAMQASTLMRDIGVTYYPKKQISKLGGDKFEISVNGKNVKFIDPLYREETAKGTVGFQRALGKDFKFKGKLFKLKTLAFDPNLDLDKVTSKLSTWDRQEGKPKFKPSNSGFYLRLGSRYINTGEGVFPGFGRWQNNLAKFRFELELPKTFIEDFGIQVNKSAKISFNDDDPKMQSFYDCIRKMTNEFANWHNDFQGKPNSEEMKEKIEKLNEKLNEYITDTGRMKPLVNTAGVLESGIVETRKSHTRDPEGEGVEPKDTGKTRTGRGKDLKPRKQRFNIPIKLDIIGNGKTMPMVDWYENDSVLNIVLNSDCEWISMFCKEPINSQMIPILKIYSYIDTISRLGRDKEDTEQWGKDMREIISAETDMLNKVLAY